MFAGAADCYARSYSAAHLADHPNQLVTDIALTPDRASPALGELRLILELRLRGLAETLVATAYCDPAPATALDCKLEGDAGGFTVTPAKGDALTVTVGPFGMHFEGVRDFIEIRADRGDDRVFRLPRAAVCG